MRLPDGRNVETTFDTEDGHVPLGYEQDGRTVRINEAEAETVRTLYGLYRKRRNHAGMVPGRPETDQVRGARMNK